MILWSIKTTIISIIFILLVHHLLIFFKETLTVPKIKDLVNAPAQKYEQMYQTMSSNSSPNVGGIGGASALAYLPTNDYVVPVKPDTSSMKNELKNFLKSQQTKGSTTDISTLDSSRSMGQYSSY